MAMVTNMLSRWVKMFFLIGAIDVRKSLRRSKWRFEFKVKLRNMELKLKLSCLEIKVGVELR